MSDDGIRKTRCELLSKICIFDIGNSVVLMSMNIGIVVNCFQKFVSLTSETAARLPDRVSILL